MKYLLLVEDHAPDIKAVRRALRSLATPHELEVMSDGVQALLYLLNREGYAAAKRPDLILLDLNLPKMTGYEVLVAVKENEAISSIPVIVMSGSEAPRDVNYSFAAGAAAYVVKPESPQTAVRLVEAIESIWFTLGRTPNAE